MKISTLSLKKNDIIAVSCPHRISDKEKERIAARFRELGIKNKVLVLDGGLEIQIIKKGRTGTNAIKRWLKWTS